MVEFRLLSEGSASKKRRPRGRSWVAAYHRPQEAIDRMRARREGIASRRRERWLRANPGKSLDAAPRHIREADDE